MLDDFKRTTNGCLRFWFAPLNCGETGVFEIAFCSCWLEQRNERLKCKYHDSRCEISHRGVWGSQHSGYCHSLKQCFLKRGPRTPRGPRETSEGRPWGTSEAQLFKIFWSFGLNLNNFQSL